MILGMSLDTFTAVHTVLSLTGIVSGFVVVLQLMQSRKSEIWTLLFLLSTILACITGFMFHTKFDPAKMIGLVSLAILAAASVSLYYNLSKKWRSIYVVSVVLALYLNVVVLVIMAFQKVPALHKIAPKQADPHFVSIQLAVIVLFGAMGWLAMKKFRPSGKK